MNPIEFLRKYQQLQYNIMFDELINLRPAIIGYSKIDKTTFWNNALLNQLVSEEQLNQIQEKMHSLNRTPAIYFEDRPDLKPLVKLLVKNKYKKNFEDSWMFYQDKEIDTSLFSSVKKVETKEDLKIFLKLFDECFQKDDPQNPYGLLGDYIKVAEKAWNKHHQTNRIECFIVYDKKEPVAVSTLTNYKGIGYISNVGSLIKVRGKGFGKLATLFCVYVSKKHGNSIHCLATEEGTYPNEFYKRIGFKTLFNGVCYSI